MSFSVSVDGPHRSEHTVAPQENLDRPATVPVVDDNAPTPVVQPSADPQRQADARVVAARRDELARATLVASVGAPASAGGGAAAGGRAGTPVARALQPALSPLLERVIARTTSPTMSAVIAETERRMAQQAATRLTGAAAAGVVGRLAGGVATAIAVMAPSPTNGNHDQMLREQRANDARLGQLGVTRDAADKLRGAQQSIEGAAHRLRADPMRLPQELDRIRAENPHLRVQQGDPLNVSSSDLERVRTRATELMQGGMPQQEAYRVAAGEVHSALATQSDRTLNRPVMYDFDRASGTARVPSEFQVRHGAPNLNDPAERALLDAHNRAVLEEVTHAAGFGARTDGGYAPMSPRAQAFGEFMESPEGRSWARARGFSDAEIDSFGPKLHEADVVDVLRDGSPFSESEIARYPVRRAFDTFVRELEADLRTRRR